MKLLPIWHFRLLTEDPSTRLGAKGAIEVDLIVIFFYIRVFFFNIYFYVKKYAAFSFSDIIPILIIKSKLCQVKQHEFFKNINWDTLARQKVTNIIFRQENIQYPIKSFFCPTKMGWPFGKVDNNPSLLKAIIQMILTIKFHFSWMLRYLGAAQPRYLPSRWAV